MKEPHRSSPRGPPVCLPAHPVMSSCRSVRQCAHSWFQGWERDVPDKMSTKPGLLKFSLNKLLWRVTMLSSPPGHSHVRTTEKYFMQLDVPST